jgi:hypothetical protein
MIELKSMLILAWNTIPHSRKIPINCPKAEISMVKWNRLKVQITIYKTLHRKQKLEECNVTFATNINEICFNMIWMHYIFKYVQIYIKVLRISPNTMVYVLILTERIAEIVNSPFLRRNYGYQSMRYLSVHLYHLIISVDYVSCHWNGQTAPGQTHLLIFSLKRDITDMSHG